MIATSRKSATYPAVLAAACALFLVGPCAKLGISQSGPGGWTNENPLHTSVERWWRLVPQAPPQEPSSPRDKETLDSRGKYFDQNYGAPWPLDRPPKGQLSGSIQDDSLFCSDSDEPPIFSNEAVVVATFESYQVYLTPSHLSIYTRARLSVDQVLLPGPSGVKPGERIDQLLPGGTLRLPGGSVLSYMVVSRRMYKKFTEKPGHRYLMFLQYFRDGNFFTDKGVWELRNGFAIPISYCYVVAAREGRAHYAGMTEADFLEAMREAVQKRQ